jgi:hypothetical protein
MRTTSLLVIAALLYSTMGLNGSIKKRLGEVNRNQLIQSEVQDINTTAFPPGSCGLEVLTPPTLGFCDCNNASGVLPPAGGSAQL